MRVRTSFALATISLGLIAAAVAPSSAASRSTVPVRHSRAAEVARIQAHFDSVLAELPARDVSSLSATQRARRSSLLATLATYRDAGVFPHNYDFPGQAVPYFVDRTTGTLCAVAYLIASTGRRDIVDRVASADNNVLVPELAGDTAFTNWLGSHGLTVAEAARIQVPYMDIEPMASERSSNSFSVGSSIALGSAVVTSLWNARTNAKGTNRLGSALGAIAGATAVGMGANSLSRDGASPVLGAATMVAGATSAWLSTRGELRHRRTAAAKREAERATVAPLLPVDGKSGAGISISLKF